MDPESFYLLSINFDFLTTVYVVSLLVLLLLSALISGAEVAFFSISSTKYNEVYEKSKGSNLVVKLLDKPKKLLATILITNNFINILIVLLFAALGEIIFKSLDYQLNFYFFKVSARFFIEIILITFLILLFGEVLPKVYANRKSFEFASFMAKPISFLNTLLTPLSLPLINLTKFAENKFGNKNNNLSVEKLSQALELTSSESTSRGEQKILEGIVNLSLIHI